MNIAIQDISPVTNLQELEQDAIERIHMAREELGKDLVILGHHYQRDEVVQFADFQGDSFQLSKEGAQEQVGFDIFITARLRVLHRRPVPFVLYINVGLGLEQH